MVLSKDDFMNQLKQTFGADENPESLTMLENLTDTYNDLEQQINTSAIDWKQKYEENDKEWSKKYRDRFFSGETTSPKDDNEQPDNNEPKSFNDLFTRKER